MPLTVWYDCRVDTQIIYETDRIRLRPWRDDEAGRLLDIQSRLEVVKWLGDDEPVLMQSREEALERIATYRCRIAEHPGLGFWAIEVKSPDPGQDGRVAGTVLLAVLPDGDGEVEIGWHLHPDSHGSGYATEAARGMLARGFADGLAEIYAVTHTTNGPSQAVCKRIGMTDLGVVSDRWYAGESQLFRLTREEYDAQQPVG